MTRRTYMIVAALMTVVAAAVRLNNVVTFPSLFGYDGFAHFAYIWFLAETGQVPLANAGWEFFQPPLYYYFMSTVWKLFAGSDPIARLQIGTGVVALMGLIPAFVTGIIVTYYFPGKRLIHLLAFGLMLFLPMHLYSAAFVGNEGLNAVLGSVCLLALWLTLRKQTMWRAVLLGFCLGAAMLVKFTALVIVAAAFATIGLRSLIKRDYWAGLKTLSVIAVVMLSVCGWFYLRNLSVYGTPFQMSRTQLFLQNAEDSQPQGQRGILEYVLFDPLILYSPQWPRGLSLHRPRPAKSSYSPLRESVLTGLYSNAWFDGFGGFVLPPISHSEVARHAGQALLTLGLIPTTIILFGLWTAFARLGKHGWDDTVVFMMVAFFAMWVVFVFGTRSVPTHAAIKATYFMPISVVFSFFFAMGLERIAEFDRAYLRRVAVACGLLAVISCVVFTHGLVVGHRWFEGIRTGAEWQNIYGVVYYAAGDRSQARDRFERSAAAGSALGQENLAALAFEDDRLMEALYRSRRAMWLHAKSRRIGNAANSRHFTLGLAEQLNSVAVIYSRLGWTKEAIATERDALSLGSPVPEVSYNLGVITLVQAHEVTDGRLRLRRALLKRADRLFRTSLSLDPGFNQARAMVGAVEAMRGNCKNAAAINRSIKTVKANSIRSYPIETGPGDINAAGLHRRRQIEPLPPYLEAKALLASCDGRQG